MQKVDEILARFPTFFGLVNPVVLVRRRIGYERLIQRSSRFGLGPRSHGHVFAV